ncbi:MAG: hypothetical protein FE78DRAFT_42097 [Acidomyces sp. 'richmondensis']|nr:MAG: hypothetical protein FE78DRAFT_42097 [Acidomyces sp. 'richmondensis']
MDIIHDLADTQIGESHTNLVMCFYEYKYTDEHFFHFLARSAKETDQLEWPQGRYKEAIAQATKDLKTVVAACLNLCLADLYHRYGSDEDKAFRIWQAVGTEGTGSTRDQSDIAFARVQALNELGIYCLQRALEEPAVAPKWIGKLENIAKKRKYGARMGAVGAIPPSFITLYLASWYHREGRIKDARDLAKAHVNDGLALLSDDDPSNDDDGWDSLSCAFVVVRDDINATAAYHSRRKFKDNIAILKSDKEEDKNGRDREDQKIPVRIKEERGEELDAKQNSTSDPASDSDDDMDTNDDDDDDDFDYVGSCDGDNCKMSFQMWDGTWWCRYCGDVFCDECRKRITNNAMNLKICSPRHTSDFFQAPILTQRFKKGEIPVGNKVFTIEDWKAGLRKQWEL